MARIEYHTENESTTNKEVTDAKVSVDEMDQMVETLLGLDLGDEDDVSCGSGCAGCRGCGSWR